MSTPAPNALLQAFVDPRPEIAGLDNGTDLTYFASIFSMPGTSSLLRPPSREAMVMGPTTPFSLGGGCGTITLRASAAC
jgi:hypothetical protein